MNMLGRRKFLVQTPFKWYTKFKLHRSDQSEVSKVLISVKGNLFLIKRATYEIENNVHTQSTLYYRFSNPDERDPLLISPYEYYGMCGQRKEDTLDLCITHHLFQYDGTSFGLDVYDNALRGLAILNQDYQQNRTLPPFLNIKREITNDPSYSNVALTHVKFTDDNNDKANTKSE